MTIERYLIALTVVGIADAVSYMVVTPSLVFYVLKNGGTTEQFGLIMSSFSFASFCTKPIIGICSDHLGFRVPYLTSLLIALTGGFVYLFATALPNGNMAVGAILAARLLGGVGGANSALGYAYVARSVPLEKQTSVNSLLSLCRILGMAIGPGVNILIAKIDIHVANNWSLDSLNSVGLILIICNTIAIASVLFLLEEPRRDNVGVEGEETGEDTPKIHDSISSSLFRNDIFLSFFSIDIFVPMLSIFTFNASFQLIETGFAPAAFDALGWGPVQSSVALGSISFVIAFNMFNVMQLSRRGVSDSDMMCGGLILSIVGYSLLYLMWTQDALVWQFYLPILLGTSSFPFLAAPTRSIFTAAVHAKPALRKYHGLMQSILSMGASVAGFITPTIVAAYCLRHPDDVTASHDHRELSPLSLFAPFLSSLVLFGMVYLRVSGKISNEKDVDKRDDREGSNDPSMDSQLFSTTANGEIMTESCSLLPVRSNSARRRSSCVEILMENDFEGFSGMVENISMKSSRNYGCTSQE